MEEGLNVIYYCRHMIGYLASRRRWNLWVGLAPGFRQRPKRNLTSQLFLAVLSLWL